LLVLGYAAFSWLRAKRAVAPRSAPQALPPHEAMSRTPEEGKAASARRVALGAMFLGRASQALSPFQFGPDWPSVPR